MAIIGILALQGAFREHKCIIEQLGHTAIEVRKPSDLDDIQGLIIPGGESTTMSKLLVDCQLMSILRRKINEKLLTLGTCAGLIILAKNVEGCDFPTIGALDIMVRRNAYGRQLNSFMVKERISHISNDLIPMTFIRAPLITKVADHVKVLHQIDNEIVAVEDGHIIGLSFHPELTKDTTIHEYFINKVTTSLAI